MLNTAKTITKTATAGGGKRFQKYVECAAEAHRQAEDEVGRREPVQNPGNLELVYFLRAVKRLEDASEGTRSGWVYGLQKAMQSVCQHPTRILTAEQLKALHGVGDFTTKMVVEVLWREYPPAELDSEEEELEEEVRRATTEAPPPAGTGRGCGRGGRSGTAAAAAGTAALGPHDIPFGDILVVPVAGGESDGTPGGRGRGRGRGRDGRRGAGRGRGRGKRGAPEIDPDIDGIAGSDFENGELAALAAVNLNIAGSQGLSPFGATAAGGGGSYGAYGGGGLSQAGLGLGLDGVGVQGVVAAPPARKRARRQSDDGAGGRDRDGWVPKPGTANYAFLIVMYMSWRRDKRRYWDKEELMAAAQTSGLAKDDIHGAKDLSAPGKASNFYDGWSCFRSMISRDPPMATERVKGKGARGKEYSLANLGWALGARLYKSAVRYGEVQPLSGLSEAEVDEDICKYCAVEDVEPVLQAYPSGTPTRGVNRGRAYKGHKPGPRVDADGGTAAAAVTAAPTGGGTGAAAALAAAPAPRVRAPSRLRQRRDSGGSSGLSPGDDLGLAGGYEDLLGSQALTGSQGQPKGSQGPGLVGSQELTGAYGAYGPAAGQGLLAGSQAGAMQAGGALTSTLATLTRPGSNLADIFTSAGQAYDNGVRAVPGAAGAAPPPTSGIRHCTGTGGGGQWAARPSAAVTAAAAGRLAAAAVAAEGTAAVAATGAAAAAAAPVAQRRGFPSTRAIEIVDLLESTDDGDDGEDDGGDANGAAGRGGGAVGLQGLGGDPPGLDTSFAFTLHSAGHSSKDSMQQPLMSQQLSQQQQPLQHPGRAGSGLGAAGGAAATTAGVSGLAPLAAAPAAAAGTFRGTKRRRPRRPPVNEVDVKQLMEMGFDRKVARKALRREGGDLSSALDRLDEGTLSPTEEPDSDQEAGGEWEEEQGEQQQPPGATVAGEGPAAQQRRGRSPPPGRQLPTAAAAGKLRLPPLAGGDQAAAAAVAAAAPADAARPRVKGTKRAAAAADVIAAVAAADVIFAGALASQQPHLQAGASSSQDPDAGFGSQQAGGSQRLQHEAYGLLGSQQQLLHRTGSGPGSQQQQAPYRVGSASQQPEVNVSQQQAGASSSQGLEAEAGGEGSDDRTLCSYEWLLPRVSEVTANHRAMPIRLPPLQPGQRFEDAYDVVLLVDNREPAPLVEALRAAAAVQGVQLVAGVSLTVGDFLWVAARRGAPLSLASREQWFVLDAVLERKRAGDLLSSVREGRYATQKFRLRRCGLRRLYYLLEESIEGFPALEAKTMRTAMQAGLLEGFITLRTAGLEDTARQLCALTRALDRQCRGRSAGGSGGSAGGSGGGDSCDDDPLPSYSSWDAGLKTLKQDMKVQAMFGLMLCAVPGLGEERVKRVIARYDTPTNLWENYKAAMRAAVAAGHDPVDAAEQLLAPEVGSILSARLYQMLFVKGAEPARVLGLPRGARPPAAGAG